MIPVSSSEAYTGIGSVSAGSSCLSIFLYFVFIMGGWGGGLIVCFKFLKLHVFLFYVKHIELPLCMKCAI